MGRADSRRAPVQGRGNSGADLLWKIQIQVLDSYNNDTYPTAQCGALYGEYRALAPELLRPPGEFQAYEIVFRAGLYFDDQYKLTRPGRFPIFQNGVLIQDNAQLSAHAAGMPNSLTSSDGHLELQFHGTSPLPAGLDSAAGAEVPVANR